LPIEESVEPIILDDVEEPRSAPGKRPLAKRVVKPKRTPRRGGVDPEVKKPQVASQVGSRDRVILVSILAVFGLLVVGVLTIGVMAWQLKKPTFASNSTTPTAKPSFAMRDTFPTAPVPEFQPPVIKPFQLPPPPELPQFQPPVIPQIPNVQKPKVEFPPVTSVAMKAAPLTEETTEVKLPGIVTDTCVGGGGRYFMMLLGEKKQIAVFDVCEAKVLKYIPIPTQHVIMAAGMNKLYVFTPELFVVTSYDLDTLKQEATQNLHHDRYVSGAYMGSASAGPILVKYHDPFGRLDRTPIAFLDPVKMVEYDVGDDLNGDRDVAKIRHASHFRASPDGTVFGYWRNSQTPSDLGVITFQNGKAKNRYEDTPVGHVIPGDLGNIYTREGVFSARENNNGKKGLYGGFTLPATSGKNYVEITGLPKTPDRPEANDGFVFNVDAHIKVPGEVRSLMTIKNLPGVPAYDVFVPQIPIDKRYLYVPEAKLFLAVHYTNSKLILEKADWNAPREDLLLVTSTPGEVKPGQLFEYQIETKSKKSEVTFKLESGPKDMICTRSGLILWEAPSYYTGREKVSISLMDQSRQQVFHNFDLKLASKVEAVIPKPPVVVVRPRWEDVIPLPLKRDEADSFVLMPKKSQEMPPTTLKQTAVVALPENADAVCLGGGGRFMILRQPKKKQLAIVDLSVAKVVKNIPLDDAKALFAAGMNILLIYSPEANTFQRWSLENFEKEATVKNPTPRTYFQLLMGNSTDGPLFVGGEGASVKCEYSYLDPKTFEDAPLEFRIGREKGMPTSPIDEPLSIRLSGDGHVLIWRSRRATTQYGMHSVVFDGKTGGTYLNLERSLYFTTGCDGTVFANSGIYTSDLKLYAGHMVKVNASPYPLAVSATHAPWYVRVTYDDELRNGKIRTKIPPQFAICLTTDQSVAIPLADHPGFRFPNAIVPPIMRGEGKLFHLLDRIVFNPKIGVMAIIDDDASNIHITPINLKAELAKTGKDYLFALSRPTTPSANEKWSYTPEVWCKTNNYTVKLISGPDGMIVRDRTVYWDVPATNKGVANAQETVTLLLSNGTSEPVHHKFHLPINGGQ